MQEPTRPGSWEGRSGWNRTSEQIPCDLPGYWRRHVGNGDHAQHGKSQRLLQYGSTGNSRETGRAVWDGGEARCTDEAAGNSGGGKGPQLKGNARSDKGPRDWR